MSFETTAPTNLPSTLKAANPIRHSSIETFQRDVLEASQNGPILVGFFSPRSAECGQLQPVLEKVIIGFSGAITLVNINIDENQELATRLGVRTVPTIMAFIDRKPVDGFMGLLPENDIRLFAQKIIGMAKEAGDANNNMERQIEAALASARQAIEAGDFSTAEEIFLSILQHQDKNFGALIGLADTYIAANVLDKAKEVLDELASDYQKRTEFISAKTRLQLALDLAQLGAADELLKELEQDPEQHQVRFNYALVLNGSGQKAEAASELIEIMRRDRRWNDDGARKKLLELFEAWGGADPATAQARRLLSAILFS